MGWMTRFAGWGFLTAGMLSASIIVAAAQDTSAESGQTDQPSQTDQPDQPQGGNQKPGIPWSSSCSASARNLPLECAIEQRAFLRQSGRLIAMITIRVPSDTKKPVAMIQAPMGLFLPAGMTVDIDGDMAQNYPFQTCNNKGCFVGFPVTDKMLNGMFTGDKLNIIFQYLDKKPFALPMSLSGFKEAYGRIK